MATNNKKTRSNLAGPGPGRPKGSPNKITREFRVTVQKLLDDNRDNVSLWLEQVAMGGAGKDGDPAKALDLLAKLAEYAAPKLARTEIAGDPEMPQKHVFSWEK